MTDSGNQPGKPVRPATPARPGTAAKPGAVAKPAQPPPAGFWDRVQALRHQPVRATFYLAVAAAVLVLAGWAWANRASETWIVVAPTDMRMAVGGSQEISVALKYKPPFRGRGSARSVAASVQVISFPTAVDIAPTKVETTAAAPEVKLTVKGLHPGQEELVVAASNRPTDQRSWQLTSVMVVVTP